MGYITDFEVTDLKPDVGAEFAKLIPTIASVYAAVELENVNNAIANAIRRTISMELKVKALAVDIGNIKTTDKYIIHELLMTRLSLIPVMQNVPVSETFSLNESNDTDDIKDIMASSLISSSGKKWFDPNFTVIGLTAGATLNINGIKIVSGYGFDHAMFALAFNCSSVATDVEPINAYTGTGVSSSVANPKKYKISFLTNGTLEPKTILIRACENLIARLNVIDTMSHRIVSNGADHTLTIDGESDTIGNLLMRTILNDNKNIPAVTYSTSTLKRSLTLKIKSYDEPAGIIANAVKNAVSVFEAIKRELKHVDEN